LALDLVTPVPTLGASLTGYVAVDREADVDLAVFDVQGRLVGNIIGGRLEPGRHRFEWSFRNAGGGKVAPGIYFLRLLTPDGSMIRKIVVQR